MNVNRQKKQVAGVSAVHSRVGGVGGGVVVPRFSACGYRRFPVRCSGRPSKCFPPCLWFARHHLMVSIVILLSPPHPALGASLVLVHAFGGCCHRRLVCLLLNNRINCSPGTLRAFLQILLRQQRLRHRASRARPLVRHLPGELLTRATRIPLGIPEAHTAIPSESGKGALPLLGSIWLLSQLSVVS